MPPRNPRLYSGRSQFSPVTRRRFLQGSAAAVSGILLSNCARNLSNTANAPASPGAEGAASPAASDPKTLHIYTWTSYIDDELLKAFETKTGIKPIVDIYDSNEVMLARLQAGGGNAYSIIYPSDYMVTQMVGMQMLTPLDKAQLQGLNQLKANWRNPVYDANNAHSVPTAWGTTGLIYDPQRLGAEITGFDYLWENVDSLTRRITLLNDVREVMGATLKYLGHSLNSTKPAEIQKAYDRLVELRPAIASFLTTGWEDQIASGDLSVSMAYSVDAIGLKDENPNLQYVLPENGTSLWTDTMAIPKTAPNAAAAYEWMNFILDPANAAPVVERLKFATPNQAVFNKLSSAVRNNKLMFPSEQYLAKCEGIAPLPPEIAEKYDRFWTQLSS